MKAFVFTDEALESDAGRFVWLAINTEQAENAGFRRQFKVQALPTYFIIDPETEQIAGRRIGGATVAQLKDFLNAGNAAVRGEDLSPSDRFVARAESLNAAGETKLAIAAYRDALGAATSSWTGYARTVETLLFALQMEGDHEATALLADDSYLRLKRTAAAANVAASGLDGALQLDEGHPQKEGLVQRMLKAVREVTQDSTIPVVADDRSGAFIALLGAYESLGDSIAARKTTEDWAAFLEGAAEEAASPAGRTVFDSHRLGAYLELGQPERAIPMLEASERDLPDDYNPPARLAVAFLRMDRLDDALAANDRALAKSYGPRQVRILLNRADIFEAKESATEARAALTEALSLAESLPEGQRSERLIAQVKRRLES